MCDITISRENLLNAIATVAKRNKKYKSVLRSIYQKQKLFVGQSLDDPQKVSYAQHPRHKFDPDRRVRTTLGKYIKRNHKKVASKFTDPQLEKFVCRVINKMNDVESRFTILRGKQVTEAYRNKVGGYSCMTEANSKYVKLYEENPKKVGLLVLDGHKARALIWKTDDGTIFVDKIYGGEHETVIELYREYSKRKGYIFRSDYVEEQENCAWGMDKSKNKPKEYKITLKTPSNNLYPYTDTFYYIEVRKNTCTLYTDDKDCKKTKDTLLTGWLDDTRGWMTEEYNKNGSHSYSPF